MKSIYLRNFVATALMVTVCFLVVAGAFIGIGRGYVLNEYQDNMNSCADEVVRLTCAISRGEGINSWALSMNLSSLANSTGNHIFLTDPEGTVITCSDRTMLCDHLGKKLSDAVMAPLEESGSLRKLSDLGGFYGKERFVCAKEIRDEDGTLMGYVFVSNAIDNILGAWSAFLSIAAVVSLVVFGLALLMSLLYSKRMARPLDEMAAASRKFARGDFSVRVRQEDDPTDEMGALIESFNKMADSLESAEARRSEFIANISHELRTPMTTIAGFADGILDGTIPKEEEEKYLRSIRDETRRLSRLVRDMLDVSQLRARATDASHRQVFDLTELILQTMLSFEARATKKDLDVDPQMPDDPILVFADRDAITQVIYNLIDNAVKFAAPGTCITIRLSKENGKALFSVKDCGETIPPDDLPFIFDRFHKSDRSRSLDKDGVGLGLYLVKAIINAHDEDIAVKSEDGVTEFVFTLALAEEKQR
ncbi:MAG: HAMP domain-containing histidine kinase [Oscillospiraceae bacterium]|nr:HAMP domain-containing histidine kinase [Oscillospiraceae bacterium]